MANSCRAACFNPGIISQFIVLPSLLVKSHFLTSRISRRLFAALLLSLLAHLLPFIAVFDSHRKSPQPSAPLQARLNPVKPTLAPETPPLHLPPRQVDRPASPAARDTGKPSKTLANWTQTVRNQLRHLDAAGQFYPAEAIANGLEGEVLVLMMLDKNGRVSAARIEQGCGHALLDNAALRAVRSLHSLPADAPRQIVIPVRFRLN